MMVLQKQWLYVLIIVILFSTCLYKVYHISYVDEMKINYSKQSAFNYKNIKRPGNDVRTWKNAEIGDDGDNVVGEVRDENVGGDATNRNNYYGSTNNNLPKKRRRHKGDGNNFQTLKTGTNGSSTIGNQNDLNSKDNERKMILSDTSTAKKTVIPKCPSDFLPNDSQYQWYLQSFKQLSPLTDKKLNKQVLPLNNNTTTTNHLDEILILTPISNVKDKLRHYFSNLCSLTYPHDKLSIVLAEDSSVDQTLIEATALRDYLQPYFRSIRIMPLKDGQPNSGGNTRHDKSYQEVRRKHLSKVRNQMLMSSLEEKFKWVFWLDADVRHIPTNVIEHLLSVNQTIVTANCLYRKDNGELDTFDRNTWQETKNSLAALSKMPEDYLMLEGYGPSKRFFLNDLKAFEYENDDGKAEAEKNIATANNNLADNNVQSRQQNNGFPSIQPSTEKRTTKKVESGRPAELDGVGGCVLLVNADLHRKGLIFPPFLFRHHIETEGMAKMAKEVFGAKIFGLPRVYVVHW